MRRVLLVVQYDGTDYHGFQRQPGLPTIQQQLERAARRVLGHDVTIIGAGRTDAGVHAVGQTATFDTDRPIPIERVAAALNAALPSDISVVRAMETPVDFHPRFHAVGKVYGYRILNRELPSPFIGRYAWHIPEPLEVDRMRAAAGPLLGRHDFAAFSSAGSAVQDTVRTLVRLDVQPEGELLELRAEADGFLYMMVRRLVGALVRVGAGRLSVAQLVGILEGGDRTRAPWIAPPQGLSLLNVIY